MDRFIAPEVILPEHLSFGNVHKETLQNGFPFYVIDGSAQNIFQLSLVFKAGRFFETKKMLAGLCAGMILKGTSKKKGYEIAENFDFYGAAVKFEANMFTAQLSLYCLTNELPQLLPLLLEVLQEANFPLEELKKAKSKTRQKLEVKKKKNSFLATQYFNQAIFGEAHPFGYLSSSDYLESISQNDVLDHYQNHFKLSEDTFGVVAGKIGAPELALLNDYFGGLPVNKSTKDFQDIIPVLNKEVNVQTANTLQAAIRIGMPSISIDHNDFQDLQILNTILGGYFGSRLMSNIREEKGYTYGIYSFVNPIMDTGYFCIATEVGAQYKNQTLHEIEHEINRLKTELVSDKELKMVRNYMIGQLMKSVDGPLQMISTLKNFLIFDLSLDEINQQLLSLHNIDAKRLQELANKYLNYAQMHKVVVG